jgi:VanZ family protein
VAWLSHTILLMVPLRFRSARLATCLAILAWCTLFVATHLPKTPIDMAGVRGADKMMHFAAYAVLSLLCCWSVSSRRRFTLVLYAWIVAALVGYAAIDELLQIPIPHRNAELLDWVADMAGAACGAVAFALIVAAKAFLHPHEGVSRDPRR